VKSSANSKGQSTRRCRGRGEPTAARPGRGTPASNRRCGKAQTRGKTGGQRSSPPLKTPAVVGVEGEAARRRIDGGGPSLVVAALLCRAVEQRRGVEVEKGERPGLECSFCRPRGRGNAGRGRGATLGCGPAMVAMNGAWWRGRCREGRGNGRGKWGGGASAPLGIEGE